MLRRNPTHQLSFARKAGFALGDYACNLYWQSVSLFLLFYYTDAVGLSGGTASLIYMVASIFDGAIDPVMGALADRTRTRMGRYRPYLLLGCVPLGLSFAFLYWAPALQGAGLLAVIMAAHLVFRVCYTTVSVPYSSLTARMTASSEERSTLAGFRMVFATLAGLTVSFLTQPIVARFGGGDQAKGFFYAACVFALVATSLFPVVFLATREPAEAGCEAPRMRFTDYWRAIRVNRAFWILMLGISFGAISSTALGKSVLYVFKYIVGDASGARYAMSLVALSGVVIIPGWVLATRVLGKRLAWLTAAGIGLAGAAALAILPIHGAVQVTLFFIYMHVAALGISMTYWSMMPDTIEYGEWRSGHRPESFIFGLGMFFQKVALGLAAGLFGLALDVVGYHANQVQTPQTLAGLKTIIVVLPMLGLTGSALVMLFYPLRRGAHEKIIAELEASRLAVQPTVLDN